MRCLYHTLIALLAAATLAGAAPRRVDLSTRNTLTSDRADVTVKRPEMSSQFGGTPMELQQWHGNFSSIGRQRSDVAGERSRMNRQTVEMETVERKTVNLPNSSNNRRRADVKNWGNLKEQVMADRFANTELRSPEGRRMQEMVDEVSLRELNRFQSQRNKTDDGIPSIEAGGESGLSVQTKTPGRTRG